MSNAKIAAMIAHATETAAGAQRDDVELAVKMIDEEIERLRTEMFAVWQRIGALEKREGVPVSAKDT